MSNNKVSVLFFGTPDFASICLQGLLSSDKYQVIGVVTNPDRPAGRGKSIKQVAVKNDLPLFQSDSLRKDIENFKTWLNQFGSIDVGVVVAFGQILTKEVLNIPVNGCINVHASILPRWRGAAPINRAIMANDSQTGVALMKMEEGLDTGDVYSEVRVPITDSVIASELHDSLAEAASSLLVNDLIKITSKKLTSTPQIATEDDKSKITYAKKITNEELRIDWARPGHNILRFIHGVSYKPGAFTYIKGTRLKIFRTTLDTDRSSSTGAKPGTILFAHGNILKVKTADDTAINILEAQLEGKKKLPISEIILSGIFNSGDIFE
jgi:methionyl-tRNA formyltransferase